MNSTRLKLDIDLPKYPSIISGEDNSSSHVNSPYDEDSYCNEITFQSP